MAQTSITKVRSAQAPRGADGQITLAAGERSSMRMWRDESPAEAKAPTTRDYETLGFVLGGKAELHAGGDVVVLEPGDSWTIPAGTQHTYKILETFSAVETTTPPA